MIELLEKSVVFLTPDNIEQVLAECTWLDTAWDLASLYLISLGLEGFEEGPDIVGLSEETTCYVSLLYFTNRTRFSDFVVHEAAHIFHNWKREYAGLPHTRTKEWLLPIDYFKRETFAWGCEVYSRIRELGRTRKDREVLLREFAAERQLVDELVDLGELVSILEEAVRARNGWGRILGWCAG